MNRPKSSLPPLTICPSCGNAERTTACRFCGIAKDGTTKQHRPAGIPFAMTHGYESDCGAQQVAFRADLAGQALRVLAVIAPPDPPVGLLDPYPLEVRATSTDGEAVKLSYPEMRYLCSRVSHQLF